MEKIAEVERSTQDELRQELRALFHGVIRLTLEMVLEEELKAMVGARRFERVGSRKTDIETDSVFRRRESGNRVRATTANTLQARRERHDFLVGALNAARDTVPFYRTRKEILEWIEATEASVPAIEMRAVK
jgi:hypothetical protein